MSRVVSPALALRASRGLLGAAALLAVWSIGQFFRTTTGGTVAPAPALTVRHGDSTSAPPTDAELSRAVATDLFAVDRSAPTVRYRIERASAGASLAPPPLVRLLGTVVSAGGRSFAMCQLGADPPRVVYAGQRIGAMKLESVSQGSATFTDDAGARVVLRVPRAGS
jgi:hypothetical protein